MEYHTKHKVAVLECLKDNQNKHLTIEEIYCLLNKSVPQATLYRIMDNFEKEGVVRKYTVSNSSPSCYQYASDSCQEHFHLLCEKCGKLIHLECDEVNELINHINEEHHFKIDVSKVNLYGLCEECKEEKR